MVTLAEMRRESVSKEGLQVYAIILAQYETRHVEAILTRLGRTPRAEFEKAIPELGDLEEMVKQEAAKVRNIENPFISCGKCLCGFVMVNQHGQPFNPALDKERLARNCECRQAWLETRKTA